MSASKRLRQITTAMAANLLLITTFAPVTIYAIEGSPPAKKAALSQEVCQSLGTSTDKLRLGLEQKKANADKLRTARSEKLSAKKDEVKSKIEAKRAEWAKKREANFAKLEARATTDEQKTAASAYVAAVRAAVSTRQAAYDEAHEVFKTGVKALHDTNKTQHEAALTTLKTEINVAITEAKAACTAEGANKETIKQELQADIKAAQDKFKASVKSGDKMKDQIKPLIEQRKVAFDAANTAFKAAMETAKTDLKAAFEGTNQDI